MNEIRPIETLYNGYRFRSRLEARWAVFFDKLSVPYIYEPEGYELGDGIRYLPDFWLPTWDRWVEIKPKLDEQNRRRAVDLLAALSGATGKIGLLFAGDVWPARTQILAVDDGGVYSDYTRIAECRRCDGLCLLKTMDDGDDDGTGSFGWGEVGPHTCRDHEHWPVENTERVMAAYRAARGARFEFRRRDVDRGQSHG